MKRTASFLLAAPLALVPALFFACGGGSGNLPPPPPQPTAPPATTSAASAAPTTPAPVEDAGPATPATPPVGFALGAASPDPPAPLPTVKFVSPGKGQVLAAAKALDFEVKLDVKNWKTATGSQHVHLILDSRPYKPLYDTKAGVKLSELTGGAALSEGQHVLVAFPSRANHESVKTKDALAIVEFFVGKKGEIKQDIAKPMLVYSRPKGDYKGDMANHLLVDFQLVNTALGDGKEWVAISVTGPGIDGEKSGKAQKFGPPWYLENLQNGDFTLKLELMGQDGKVLPGPWNSTTRTIHVDRDAPAEPMSHGPSPAADAGAPAADAGHH